jgi:adenosylhomocysteine nucleosidase
VAETVKAENTPEEFASDRQLVEIGLQCGATRVSGFVTASTIVNSSVEKRRLARMADAVDMETIYVFKQARETGTPVVAVRALSDNAEHGIPLDFNPFVNEHGEINRLPAIREVMKAPHRIPQLIRFGVDSSRAARNLAIFLDRYATMLANVRQLPVDV